MNNFLKTSIQKALNKEYLRRLLNKYFIEKGYDNFDKTPNPPAIADLILVIPQLNGIAEISYTIEDINLTNNVVKMEWNIFIFGNQRIFLGYTEHGNITDISNSNQPLDFNGPITIKSIIDSMINIIEQNDIILSLHNRPASRPVNFNSLTTRSITPMPFRRMN